MIEALKDEVIVNRAGGRFKLCALIQRRLVELMEGARPLVERKGRTDLEIVIDEIMQEKICIDHESAAAALDGVTQQAGALPAAAELL